jgi:hypothetical protein
MSIGIVASHTASIGIRPCISAATRCVQAANSAAAEVGQAMLIVVSPRRSSMRMSVGAAGLGGVEVS